MSNSPTSHANPSPATAQTEQPAPPRRRGRLISVLGFNARELARVSGRCIDVAHKAR